MSESCCLAWWHLRKHDKQVFVALMATYEDGWRFKAHIASSDRRKMDLDQDTAIWRPDWSFHPFASLEALREPYVRALQYALGVVMSRLKTGYYISHSSFNNRTGRADDVYMANWEASNWSSGLGWGNFPGMWWPLRGNQREDLNDQAEAVHDRLNEFGHDIPILLDSLKTLLKKKQRKLQAGSLRRIGRFTVYAK